MGDFDEWLMWQQIAFMQKHSQYGMPKVSDNDRRLKDMEKEMMGDDNMEQRKFKVGDIVKGNHPIFAKGKIGIVKEVDETDDELPYRVDFIGETDYWIEEKFLELVEGKKITGNKIIDLLMKELGVEIDEEFEMEGSSFNPYHFRSDGMLVDIDDEERPRQLGKLILGTGTFKKIPKPEIKEMTVAELEEALKLPKGTLRVKGDD